MHNLANVRCNGPQQIPKFQARCDTTGQIQKQLQPLILLLHTSEIQTVIQREGDDTADQPKETYLFSAKRIHCVANEAENTQLAMRGCQWYAYHRAHAHFFGPWPEAWIPLLRIPIDSLLWVTTTHSIPQGQQLFYGQVRKRQRPLTPNQIFDFLSVLFHYNEEKVIKVQELADFICESCSQLFRFTARSDPLADAHNRLIAVAVYLRLNDRLCIHSLIFSAEARAPNCPR